MELKLTKLVGAAALGSAVLLSGQALAQSKNDKADTRTAQAQTSRDAGTGSSSSRDSGSSSAIEQRTVEDKKDWGWLGLLGLVGLAGLRRQRQDDDVTGVRRTA